MKTTNTGVEIELLLELIDQAYDHHAWHGTNLRGSIRGLTAEQAAWRPAAGRHNIWEIVMHTAYWKYAVRRRLLDEKRGSFPIRGSNWFARPATASEAAWREDLALLQETHRSFRRAVAEFSPAALTLSTARKKFTNAAVIYGVASHDLYHAGQIQLLKRLHT
jgi:uncharacterized damage-inducible protein DinB